LAELLLALLEQSKRRLHRRARESLTAFINAVAPEYIPARHHRLLIEKLEAVDRGEIKRLMVFMPPGSAKSTYANVLYAPWYMGRHPDRSIITASYGQELADKWGRRSRNIVAGDDFKSIFGFGLAGDSQAANRWATSKGSEYLAVGVGGPVTGNRADGGIIDDPVKGREEADSLTIRTKTREWYKADFYTRLKPGAWIILIMTRWHEDDLAGWLLEEEKAGGDKWDILSLPAEAEVNDPLGRQPGELLWPEWFTSEMFQIARRDTRNWAALYQQRPSPDTGDFFRAVWLHEYDELPPRDQMRVYGASDYAVTAEGGDWTVHIVIGVDPDDNMYVLDLWRQQTTADVWIEAFCDLVLQWKPMEWAEESGQINAAIGPFLERRQRQRKAYAFRRQFPSRHDKAVRAQAIRARMAMKGLWLPRSLPWASLFRGELLSFPAGKHDDQVDALSLIGQLLDDIRPGQIVHKDSVPMAGDHQVLVTPPWDKRGKPSWQRTQNKRA